MKNVHEIIGSDPKMRERIRKATEAHRREHEAKANGHANGRLLEPAVIQLAGGKLHEHVRAAEAVLAEASASEPFTGIYARGAFLTRPIRLAADRSMGGIQRKAGALMLVPVEPDHLRLRLTELARWQRFVQRERKWVDVDAPEAVAKGVMASAPWPGMPSLSGIVEAPTLRADGSLLDRPGYDQQTGLLFDPNGTKFPPIPQRPTRAEAEAALEQLLELFEHFPFVDEASRAVAAAGCITGLVRRALRAAPLFGFSAPKMASGKTLIASVIAYLATGRDPAMITETSDPENERKRLFSVLLDGDPIVLLDNVEGKLKSSALCAILTAPLYSDRLLGINRKAVVATNAMFMATGNNFTVSGDLSSRTLLATIDPKCERPEEREFAVDLLQTVSARRGDLVAAALAIPLAYLAAGAPKQAKPFGRFEDWARWCRDPLLWLGMEDPCKTRERVETRDPVREQLRALLASWRKVFGEHGQAIATAITLKAQVNTDAERYDALHAAIGSIARRGREIDARTLGNFISQHEGRIEGDLCFARAGTRNKVTLWSAQKGSGP